MISAWLLTFVVSRDGYYGWDLHITRDAVDPSPGTRVWPGYDEWRFRSVCGQIDVKNAEWMPISNWTRWFETDSSGRPPLASNGRPRNLCVDCWLGLLP